MFGVPHRQRGRAGCCDFHSVLGRRTDSRNEPQARQWFPGAKERPAGSGHHFFAVFRRAARHSTQVMVGSPNYGLGAGFLAAGAFAAVPFSPPCLLSRVKASLALNGKRRTDCSPVVLRVTSTRRLLARRTVRRFFRIFCFSAGLSSLSASINFATSSEAMFFSKPKALVSR